MPKIKGWRRIDKNRWRSRKSIISVEYNRKVWGYQPPTGWYVWLHRRGSNPRRIKRFKTKEYAIRFAINWMKRHPKG